MKHDGRISASEIGDYIYCKRGWYLRQNGLLEQTDLMRQGISQHNAQFLSVERLKVGRFLAIGFLLIGTLLIILYFLFQSLSL